MVQQCNAFVPISVCGRHSLPTIDVYSREYVDSHKKIIIARSYARVKLNRVL